MPLHNRGFVMARTGAVALTALALLVALVGGAVAAVGLSAAQERESASSVLPAVGRQLPARPVADPAPAAPRVDGLDPSTCLPQPERSRLVGDPGAGATVVTFVVPATVRIVVDGGGRPLTVSTNTGQAPCITDVFISIAPDGAQALADRALTSVVLGVPFGAGWSPGVEQRFPDRSVG